MKNLHAIAPNSYDFDIIFRKRRRDLNSSIDNPCIIPPKENVILPKINREVFSENETETSQPKKSLVILPPILDPKKKRKKLNLSAKRRLLSYKYLKLYMDEDDNDEYEIFYNDDKSNSFDKSPNSDNDIHSRSVDEKNEQINDTLYYFDNLPEYLLRNCATFIVKNAEKVTKGEKIEIPNKLIIHNVYLKLILNNVFRKVEIRNQYNQVISIEKVINLLQNEILEMQERIKSKKNKKVNKKKHKRNINNVLPKTEHSNDSNTHEFDIEELLKPKIKIKKQVNISEYASDNNTSGNEECNSNSYIANMKRSTKIQTDSNNNISDRSKVFEKPTDTSLNTNSHNYIGLSYGGDSSDERRYKAVDFKKISGVHDYNQERNVIIEKTDENFNITSKKRNEQEGEQHFIQNNDIEEIDSGVHKKKRSDVLDIDLDDNMVNQPINTNKIIYSYDENKNEKGNMQVKKTLNSVKNFSGLEESSERTIDEKNNNIINYNIGIIGQKAPEKYEQNNIRIVKSSEKLEDIENNRNMEYAQSYKVNQREKNNRNSNNLERDNIQQKSNKRDNKENENLNEKISRNKITKEKINSQDKQSISKQIKSSKHKKRRKKKLTTKNGDNGKNNDNDIQDSAEDSEYEETEEEKEMEEKMETQFNNIGTNQIKQQEFESEKKEIQKNEKDENEIDNKSSSEEGEEEDEEDEEESPREIDKETGKEKRKSIKGETKKKKKKRNKKHKNEEKQDVPKTKTDQKEKTKVSKKEKNIPSTIIKDEPKEKHKKVKQERETIEKVEKKVTHKAPIESIKPHEQKTIIDSDPRLAGIHVITEEDEEVLKRESENKLKQLREFQKQERDRNLRELVEIQKQKERKIKEERQLEIQKKQEEEKRQNQAKVKEYLEEMKKHELTQKSNQNPTSLNSSNSSAVEKEHNDILRRLLLQKNPNFFTEYKPEKETPPPLNLRNQLQKQEQPQQKKKTFKVSDSNRGSKKPTLIYDNSYLFEKEKSSTRIFNFDTDLNNQKEEEENGNNQSPTDNNEQQVQINKKFRFKNPRKFTRPLFQKKKYTFFQEDPINKILKEKHEIKKEETINSEDEEEQRRQQSKKTDEMMKEFFKKINDLKNAPPEEYRKQIEQLIDNQIEGSNYAHIKKRENRMNAFLEKLNTYRKQKEINRKLKSDKFRFIRPWDFFFKDEEEQYNTIEN